MENSQELFRVGDKIVEQSDLEFAKVLKDFDRVIYSDINRVPSIIFEEAIKSLTFIVRQQPMMEGRLELLNYFIEQAVSHSYHRYGNIGARGIVL